MLCVFGLVAVIGVQGAMSFIHTRAQAERQDAIVRSLVRRNQILVAREHSLLSTPTIVQEARKLGMVRPGEQPYVVVGGSSVP
jgi:cell division protein FtsB